MLLLAGFAGERSPHATSGHHLALQRFETFETFLVIGQASSDKLRLPWA
jgi:hypothetical protein